MLRTSLNRLLSLSFLAIAFTLGGCVEELDNSATDTNYPHLLSAPQATAVANGTGYDVSVTLEAAGPSQLQLVEVHIFSLQNSSEVADAVITLQPVAGTNGWNGTTDSAFPLAGGEYQVKFVALYDGDINATSSGIVKSGIYEYNANANTLYYSVLQMAADYSTDPYTVVDGSVHAGVSNIAVAQFSTSAN